MKTLLALPTLVLLASSAARAQHADSNSAPKTYLIKKGRSVIALRVNEPDKIDLSLLINDGSIQVIHAPRFDGIDLNSIALSPMQTHTEISDLIRGLLGENNGVTIVPIDKARVSTQDAIVDPK